MKVWARVKKWTEVTDFHKIFESTSLLDFTSFIDDDGKTYHLSITTDTMYSYFINFYGEWVISKKYDIEDDTYNQSQVTNIKNIIDMIARVNKYKYRVLIKSVFEQYDLDNSSDYSITKVRTPNYRKDGGVEFRGTETRGKSGTEKTTNSGNIENDVTTYDNATARLGSKTVYNSPASELSFTNRNDTLSFTNRANVTSEMVTGTETTTEKGFKNIPGETLQAAREAAQFNVLDVLMKDVLDKITLSIII